MGPPGKEGNIGQPGPMGAPGSRGSSGDLGPPVSLHSQTLNIKLVFSIFRIKRISFSDAGKVEFKKMCVFFSF